ncbi:hypothetical protein [Streptomyces sp. Agncl-13]|uniref:hypothetical protein n=1 Tax=Streptomyces sp. Agncl-13 TaxID=3400628 RepID=UPI003A8B1C73
MGQLVVGWGGHGAGEALLSAASMSRSRVSSMIGAAPQTKWIGAVDWAMSAGLKPPGM